MHATQVKLLRLAHQKTLKDMTLVAIAGAIGERYAQTAKHHLGQLVKKRLLKEDWKPVGESEDTGLFSIPIYGLAHCGPATLFTEEHLEGYLKVSEKLLPRKKRGLFALKALGHSLNRSDISGSNIESGDYVIIDGDVRNPKKNDYVLAVIDGSAILKKFFQDKEKILLLSESTESYPPIVLHSDDEISDLIGGTVLRVIKIPK